MTKLPYLLMDQLVCELVHLEKLVERVDYEPRGLPKRQCVGFVVEDPLRFMLNLGRTIASDNVDPAVQAAFDDTPIRRTMMGRTQIVYFPDVEIEWDE